MIEPAPPVALAGLAAVTCHGRDLAELETAVLAGTPVVRHVDRFSTAGRRVDVAATLADARSLTDELGAVIRDACLDAGLRPAERAATGLMLAVHAAPDAARLPPGPLVERGAAALAERLAAHAGLAPRLRVYINGCVAGSSAITDAATLIRLGRVDRVVVAGGYLVEQDQFALFDAGRVLAADGVARPFSSGRHGTVLGDGVAAVVVESLQANRERGGRCRARLVGWGQTGDAYHRYRPHPEGAGLARCIAIALRRAGLQQGEIGYVNAQGTATERSDRAEAGALRTALGAHAQAVPVSATKSTHGHALEGSALVELIVTVLAVRGGRLPVNANFLAPDPDCRLNLVLRPSERVPVGYGMTLNSAMGGANTALVVSAPC
jgi:3-oxoacyl-[acyl-carrier-protein] synthase II